MTSYRRKISVGILLALAASASLFTQQATAKETRPYKQELFLHLEYTDIPNEVTDMAVLGKNRCQIDPLKSQLSAQPWDAVGGGRQKDWIYQTFGLPEDEIIRRFSELPPPRTWRAHEIETEYDQLVAKRALKNPAKPTFTIVHDVGINGLCRSRLVSHGIVQLASQFNYLESPGNHIVPVSQYLHDQTQGPQGAIETAATTLYRHAMVTSGKLPNALHDVLPKDHQKYYTHGYLELGKLDGASCKILEKIIEANLSQLEVLPQWAISEASGRYHIQVFAAAPSFQGFTRPKPESSAARIAETVVVKQYELIAKLAVVHTSTSGYDPVPLHLTLVGQGAYNNPETIVEKALNAVAQVVKGHDVNVYIHVYHSPQMVELIENAADRKFEVIHMTRDEFHKAGSK